MGTPREAGKAFKRQHNGPDDGEEYPKVEQRSGCHFEFFKRWDPQICEIGRQERLTKEPRSDARETRNQNARPDNAVVGQPLTVRSPAKPAGHILHHHGN